MLLCGTKGGLRYSESLQTWKPLADRGYWLGWEGDPPGPQSLLRPKIIVGSTVMLEDGQAWICPMARLYDGTPNLPLRIGLDDEGGDAAEIVERYRALWELGEDVWRRMRAEVDTGVVAEKWTVAQTLDAAVVCLATNYRINAHAAKAVGLLTTENVAEILRVLVDFGTFRAMLAEFVRTAEGKKKVPA